MKVFFDLWGRRMPPFFYSPLTSGQREGVRCRMEGHRFDESIILGGAAPCPWGGLRVLVCAPASFAEPGAPRPFPTTFWLLCPWLVRRAGEVESAGGVRALEAWIMERGAEEWKAYGRLHALLRLGLLGTRGRAALAAASAGLLEAVARGGAGGTRGDGVRVKCLHLQTASLLALGTHPGAEWLREQGLTGDCGRRADCPLRRE